MKVSHSHYCLRVSSLLTSARRAPDFFAYSKIKASASLSGGDMSLFLVAVVPVVQPSQPEHCFAESSLTPKKQMNSCIF